MGLHYFHGLPDRDVRFRPVPARHKETIARTCRNADLCSLHLLRLQARELDDQDCGRNGVQLMALRSSEAKAGAFRFWFIF